MIILLPAKDNLSWDISGSFSGLANAVQDLKYQFEYYSMQFRKIGQLEDTEEQMANKLNQQAQGDVLVTVMTEENFKQAQERNLAPRAKNIVAFGEVTGHHHQAFGEGIEVLEDPTNPFQLWVVAPNGGELRHVDEAGVLTGEHDTIVFSPGWTLIDLQRESDPLTGAETRVRD